MSHPIEQFLSYLETEKNYSSHTFLNYKSDLEEFIAFLGNLVLVAASF